MRLILILTLVSCGLACADTSVLPQDRFPSIHGAVVRGDTSQKTLSLVFTGDEYADGGERILSTLRKHNVSASFFLTGNFYRNSDYSSLVIELHSDGHYLGAHSNRHLLYCSWENRDSLLITRAEFDADLDANYAEMSRFGIVEEDARYFLPPFEWHNKQISLWTAARGLRLINFTSGTRSNTDYTTPDMGDRYVPSDVILESILSYEEQDPNGLNGFILLLHVGTDPVRTDKMYDRLDDLIVILKERGYDLVRIDALLN